MVLEVGRLSLQPGRLSEIKCVVFVTERYELGCWAGVGWGGRCLGGGGVVTNRWVRWWWWCRYSS